MGKILLFLSLCFPAAVLGKDYFTAAVFEHRPRASNTSKLAPREKIVSNLEYYKKAVVLATEKGADIIVFNELGLFPYPGSRENFRNYAENVPDPRKEKFNPCTTEKATDRYILSSLSCLARENNIYIVANMLDTHPCDGTCDADKIDSCADKCPGDGVFFYNTNVAFDREGNIIARYHKMHPYFESVNVPDEPEFVTFETSFGKFGLIICFDSVFEEATQLVTDHGIDTLVFPTYWFEDIVPFNTVEWQQSWAFANRVNFISANTQTPGTGSLGSGIFSKADGALIYTYEPDGNSKLLLANVRINGTSEIPDQNSITVITHDNTFLKVETGDKFPEVGYEKVVGPAKDMYMDYRYFTSQTEGYTKVKLEESAGEIKACNEGFCCSLTYSAVDLQDDFYLVVFNGTNNVRGYFKWWEETCMLIRCDPFEDEPCAIQPPTTKTVFKNVQLKAQFSEGLVYPTVTKNKFRLAPKSEWSIITHPSETGLTFHSDSSEPLLKVGLLGRIYKQDPPFVPFFKN